MSKDKGRKISRDQYDQLGSFHGETIEGGRRLLDDNDRVIGDVFFNGAKNITSAISHHTATFVPADGYVASNDENYEQPADDGFDNQY